MNCGSTMRLFHPLAQLQRAIRTRNKTKRKETYLKLQLVGVFVYAVSIQHVLMYDVIIIEKKSYFIDKYTID